MGGQSSLGVYRIMISPNKPASIGTRAVNLQPTASVTESKSLPIQGRTIHRRDEALT